MRQLDGLPPDLQQEVYDFARFLFETKTKPRRRGKLRFAWAEGLREYRDRCTPLDLQRKALKWWSD